MIRETLNCVRCCKPAKFWSGHVDYFKYTGNRMRRVSVIAGWCSNRCFNDRGFRGMYSFHMGDRNGKQPSPCRTTTSPKRDNMIHINYNKVSLISASVIFGEGCVLLYLTIGTVNMVYGLAFAAFGSYAIITNKLFKRD